MLKNRIEATQRASFLEGSGQSFRRSVMGYFSSGHHFRGDLRRILYADRGGGGLRVLRFVL